VLLFAGPFASAQRSAEDLRALGKLEPWCARLYETSGALPLTASAPAEALLGDVPLSRLFHYDPQLLLRGRLRVQIECDADGPPAAAFRTACQQAVPSLLWEGATGRLAQVTLALGELPLLAAVPEVVYVMRPPVGLSLVTSEGVAEIGADRYHDLGQTGAGISIGVLDVGFAGAGLLLGTELPAHTQMHAFVTGADGEGDISGGGNSHGTACAEIVHDVAPGADLFLANAMTPVALEAAARWLRDQGVSVISHSVGWFWGPGDGTGDIADIANEAIDSGVLWVNAAGNQARGYWEGSFLDSNGDGRHEFDAAGDTSLTQQNVPVDTEFWLVLTWDNWPASPDLSYEIDLYENDVRVASSADAYSSLRHAFREIPSYRTQQPGSRIDVVIRRGKGSAPSRLRLFRVNGSFAEHGTPRGSLVLPADVPRVLAVGAYRSSGSERILEDFSSRGPTQTGLPKPELGGLDMVSTVTEPAFLGTSAACPLAAGAAGLLYSAAPEGGFFDFRWTIGEIRELMRWSAAAIDLGAPDGSVWGVLNLPRLEPGRPENLAAPRLRVTSPTRPPITLRLLRHTSEPVRLQIFAADGRLLSERRLTARAVAQPVPCWDGRGPDGRRLPSGRYTIRARGSDWAEHVPLLMIR
jgi:hypothetical protein